MPLETLALQNVDSSLFKPGSHCALRLEANGSFQKQMGAAATTNKRVVQFMKVELFIRGNTERPQACAAQLPMGNRNERRYEPTCLDVLSRIRLHRIKSVGPRRPSGVVGWNDRKPRPDLA